MNEHAGQRELSPCFRRLEHPVKLGIEEAVKGGAEQERKRAPEEQRLGGFVFKEFPEEPGDEDSGRKAGGQHDQAVIPIEGQLLEVLGPVEIIEQRYHLQDDHRHERPEGAIEQAQSVVSPEDRHVCHGAILTRVRKSANFLNA